MSKGSSNHNGVDVYETDIDIDDSFNDTYVKNDNDTYVKNDNDTVVKNDNDSYVKNDTDSSSRNNQTFNIDDSKTSDDDVTVTKNSTETNTSTETFTKTETDIDDSFNTKTDDSTDDSYNTETETKIEESYNSSTENTSVNVALENALNTHKVDDSYNTKNESRVETETKIEDSYNHTDKSVDIDSEIDDAFNDYANAFNDASTSFGNIDVDFSDMFNGALGGDGNDNGFAVSQVANILDADSLYNVQQNNGGGNFQLHANAGDAMFGGGDSWECVDDPFSGAGDSIVSTADASANITASAFNLEIVLGANLQQNAIDSTVIGGNSDNDSTVTNGDSF